MRLPQTGDAVHVRGAPEGLRSRTSPIFEAEIFDLLKAYGTTRSRAGMRNHKLPKPRVMSLDDARNRLRRALNAVGVDFSDWVSLDDMLPDGADVGADVGDMCAAFVSYPRGSPHQESSRHCSRVRAGAKGQWQFGVLPSVSGLCSGIAAAVPHCPRDGPCGSHRLRPRLGLRRSSPARLTNPNHPMRARRCHPPWKRLGKSRAPWCVSRERRC